MTKAVAKVEGCKALLRAESFGIRDSLTLIIEGFEKFNQAIADFCSELREAHNEQSRKEIREHRRELDIAKKEIVHHNKCSRNIYFKIKGLPVVENQVPTKRLKEIAMYLGVELREGGVKIAHRVQSKEKQRPNVVVKFSTRTARDRVLSAAAKTAEY